ncbi:DNA-processing protein DprA [Actinomycetaceae bacterium MB13-C1-2]|nr:DNA-processing protein DprA [Actinomycetaceae bacterium MB13-C1-2]
MSTITDHVRDERTARIMLSIIADPADPTTGEVLCTHGGIETLRFLESEGRVPTVDDTKARIWRERLAPKLDLGVLATADGYQQLGFNTLIPGDQHWPKALASLGVREPYLLWVKGATSFLSMPLSDRVAITGMRASTNYGNHVATDMAQELAQHERILVAGGAYGIESAANHGAMSVGGQVIVVMGNGLDHRYPSFEKPVLDAIGDVGLLVSEVPPSTSPRRGQLLARHRLIAALAGATVVVEAAMRSGAINIAAEAISMGRKVGAVPGPVTSVSSYTPHELIRQGVGSLVTNASDVLYLLDHRERGAGRSFLNVDRPMNRSVEPTALSL